MSNVMCSHTGNADFKNEKNETLCESKTTLHEEDNVQPNDTHETNERTI